jgi:hypothetical protein
MKKIAALACAFCLCSVALQAQSLSVQNLIDLKKAGVDKAILVQQIQADGINFQMDANTTIRLKSLGFPDEVLSALLIAGSKKASPGADDPIKTLYSQGKYPELCDYLNSLLEKNPRDYRSRAILIGTLLKIDRQTAALVELQNLSAQTKDSAAKPYVDRASLMVSNWQKQEEVKNKLLLALQNYSYADADSLIDQLAASAAQKGILHMIIDSYAGKFGAVLARNSQLQTMSFVDQKRVDAVKDKITESKNNYNLLMDKADDYVHLACGYNKLKQPSLADYADVVGKLTRVAPLSPEVIDLVFHVALLSSKYDNLQALGDKILAAKGTIRIPFYTYPEYFDMVIDIKLRTLYTQTHVLRDSQAQCPWPDIPGWSFSRSQALRAEFFPQLVPFNLAFDQVKGVSQRMTFIGHEAVAKHSYVLSFDPEGVAPRYAMDGFMVLEAGEGAILQSTRNLGLYILHVIGNPNIKAELADPEKAKKTSHGFGFGDALVALYGATNGRTPLGAAAVQMMADNKAKSEAAAQEQQATWQAMLVRGYSDLLNGSVFESLDKLIAVTQ